MTEPITPTTPMRVAFTPESQETILFDDQDKAVQHVLESLIGMSPETIAQAKAWMDFQNANTMPKLMDLNYDSPKTIQQPEYKIGNTKHRLDKWTNVSLHFICKYGAYMAKALKRIPEDGDWLLVTIEDFKQFKLQEIMNKDSQTATPQTPTTPPPFASPQVHYQAPMSANKKKLESIKKSVKLDYTVYPKLQDNKHIEPFWRSFKALAKHQDMSEILDPYFKPDQDDPDAVAAFRFQQDFMFNVVQYSFLTDNTKTYVREHYHDFDAQKVIAKLIQFMKNSPRNTMEINLLTNNITSLKLDNNWKGTTEQFLLHFQEQFRLLDDLVNPDERMCPRFRRILLETAVQDMPMLRNITNTDELHRVVGNNKSTNYEQYFNLLLVAAQKYDHNSRNNPYKNKRTIFQNEADDPGDGEPYDTQAGTLYGGIDLPPERLYQAFYTNKE